MKVSRHELALECLAVLMKEVWEKKIQCLVNLKNKSQY